MSDGSVLISCRPLEAADWEFVRRIYAEGIATRNATFETEVPTEEVLNDKWLAGHRWVAVAGDGVAGWAAMTATSPRECYRGVVETSVYVSADFRGRGVGKALVQQQASAADAADLWTLQTSIFPENLASLAGVGNLRTFPAPTSFFGDDFAPSDLSEGDDKWVRAVALPANAHQAGMFAEYPDCRSLGLLV